MREFTGTGLFIDGHTGEMVMGIVENGKMSIVKDFSIDPEEAAETDMAVTLSNFHRLARSLESGNMKLARNYDGNLTNFGLTPLEPAPLADSNVITSHLRLHGSPLHKVAIDLDRDAALIPTSTKGHHHLIIDKVLPWENYHRLLRELKVAGLIELGYYTAAVNRKATVLRTPWTKK